MEGIPEKYRKDLDIIRETVEQINRDMHIPGVELTLSGEESQAFEKLRNQLIPVIENLYKSDKSTFNSLLYRIDISEKNYRETLNQEGDFAGKIAELIIRREFQKVLTRRFFKKTQNK